MSKSELSGFGDWELIARRLLEDHPSTCRKFYKIPHPKAILRSYEPEFRKAFSKVLKGLRRNKKMIYPTKYFLQNSNMQCNVTHAICIIGDANRVHIFDPNGSYPKKYDDRVRFDVSSPPMTTQQMLSALKHIAKAENMPIKISMSRRGFQPDLPEYPSSKYIRNSGYCMFINRRAIQYILDNMHEENDLIAAARKLENISHILNWGPYSKSVLQDIWPHP